MTTAVSNWSASGREYALECDHIVQEFRVNQRGRMKKAIVSAVSDVSFNVRHGETFAIVGETGSGKTTLGRTIIRSPMARSGSIRISGHEISGGNVTREVSQLAQMIFQDPFSALDPKWTVERIVAEPLATRGEGASVARRRKIAAILDRVGLSASRFAISQPHELSGGQAQRVAIARALVASPDLVICDEPVTALDVSIQAQILKLLFELKDQLGLTYLLIAHDLAVVNVLADRIATMYLGKFCELASTTDLFTTPAHPYTAALLSAIPPRPGMAVARERIRLLGEPPSPLDPPSGCRFRTRCRFAEDICATVEPQMRDIGHGHQVACHFPLVKVE